MRQIFAILTIVLSSTFLASAVEKPELDRRIQKHQAKFEALQRNKPIPAAMLKKARGIVLLDRTKAGFIFAYQGGTGIAMVRDKDNKWGPVAFLEATEASLGFQIGGQQSFLVMLLMNEDATKMLIDPNFEFGGEARGTAGDATAGAEGTVKTKEQPVLIYDQREGLFGGAAIKGGALSPDSEANHAYYEEMLTVKEILFEGKAQPSKNAVKLGQVIDSYTTSEEEK